MSALALAALTMSAAPAMALDSPSIPVYPPAAVCSLLGQPSTVVPGATVVLTGGGAAVGGPVTAVLQPTGTTIGTATADSTGNYSVSATVPPGLTSPATISVDNQTCATVLIPNAPTTAPSTPVPSVSIAPIIVTATPAASSTPASASASASVASVAPTITPTTVATAVTSSKAASGPLAFTGTNALLPAGIGAILLVAGAVFTLAGRRGRRNES